MRTTVTIDDKLFANAVAMSEPGMDKAEIIRQAVKTYVEVQASRRWAALGGSMPGARPVPRRRPPAYRAAEAE